MHKKIKIIIIIICLICAGLSFLFYIGRNKSRLDGLVATVNINIELDKAYHDSIVIVTKPNNGIKQLTPTGSISESLKNVVVHTAIQGEYLQGIAIRILCQQEQVKTIISSIDNISVFVGNKLYYYSNDIAEWDYTTNEDFVEYSMPTMYYQKSSIKPWINWYGDLNFLLREIVALVTTPFNFILVYAFALIAFFLMYVSFNNEVCIITKRYNKQTELLMLFLLLAFAFLLRFATYTKYSAWYDELWSATIASNPNKSIANVFNDPGNPPFYYLILYIFFANFGYSEEIGRFLSVLIGTGSILTLYLFVRAICGKKYAFISAFLMAISIASIGFSNQMRAYVLVLFLCPLVSYIFFLLLQKFTFSRYIYYIICGIILVNTHYYGILFIAGTFLFYYIYNKYSLEQVVAIFVNKQYISERKQIIFFSLANCIIAISLVPFFATTAFKRALLDKGFNTWLPAPGKKETIYAVVLILAYIAVRLFLIFMKKNKYFNNKISLLTEYSVFLITFIYASALLISLLYRNIFYNRYLIICLPLAVSIVPFFVSIVFANKAAKLFKKYFIIASAVICILFSNYIKKWDPFGGIYWDVNKESQKYIVSDAARYSSPAQIYRWNSENFYQLYGTTPLPGYSKDNYHDIVYINAQHISVNDQEKFLKSNGISNGSVLRVRIDGIWGEKYLYKARLTD